MLGLTVSKLPPAALARRVWHGITLETPPFITRICSPLKAVHDALGEMYGAYGVLADDDVPDFYVRITGTGGLRRFYGRQAMAHIDMPTPFIALPEHMAALMLEQALNWSVAMRVATHLLFHAAVVEKDGKAVLIPGESGQGKSTLCATLVARGWRHLSDELAMIDLETGLVVPYPRPISLKNASIGLMQEAAPDQHFSATYRGTPKGDVAYMIPSSAALQSAYEPARPHAILVPRYSTTEAPRLEPMPPSQAFLYLSACSINYNGFGEQGFDMLIRLAEDLPVCSAYYGDIESSAHLAEQALAL